MTDGELVKHVLDALAEGLERPAGYTGPAVALSNLDVAAARAALERIMRGNEVIQRLAVLGLTDGDVILLRDSTTEPELLDAFARAISEETGNLVIALQDGADVESLPRAELLERLGA